MNVNGTELPDPPFAPRKEETVGQRIARELDQRCQARVANEMATGKMPIGKSGLNLIVAYRDEATNAIIREAETIHEFLRTIYGIMCALHVKRVEIGPENFIMVDQHVIVREDKLAEKPGNNVFIIYDKNEYPGGKLDGKNMDT